MTKLSLPLGDDEVLFRIEAVRLVRDAWGRDVLCMLGERSEVGPCARHHCIPLQGYNIVLCTEPICARKFYVSLHLARWKMVRKSLGCRVGRALTLVQHLVPSSNYSDFMMVLIAPSSAVNSFAETILLAVDCLR